MKKIFLASMACGLVLFLAGCTQQKLVADQDIEQPTDGVEQNTNQTVSSDVSVVEAPETKTDPSLCAANPTTTEAGSEVYPIDQKYKNFQFLGQLFTAYECGQERISKIFGVEGENYTLGSSVWLKGNPSQALIGVFKSIGYVCKDNNTEENCKNWELRNTVKVNSLMKLEPFYENFKSDDCTNCG